MCAYSGQLPEELGKNQKDALKRKSILISDSEIRMLFPSFSRHPSGSSSSGSCPVRRYRRISSYVS